MIQSYSQYGQDKYIYENFFSNKLDGFYVDIGAYDGVKLSNTYLFEKLGWEGFCFEPSPNAYQKLIVNRLKSSNLNVAIGHKDDCVNFLDVVGEPDMLSGVLDYYNTEHLFRINKEVFETKSTQDCIQIRMVPLVSIVSPDQYIDYLSLDTEGGEDIILKNILESFTPTVISVEVNYQQDFNKIYDLIKDKYNVVKQLGCDLILKVK